MGLWLGAGFSDHLPLSFDAGLHVIVPSISGHPDIIAIGPALKLSEPAV